MSGRNRGRKGLSPLYDEGAEPEKEAMKHVSGSAASMGLAMGMFFVIVGVMLDSLGVAALGVVVMLTGLYARSHQH
jgi:hypothetical protein